MLQARFDIQGLNLTVKEVSTLPPSLKPKSYSVSKEEKEEEGVVVWFGGKLKNTINQKKPWANVLRNSYKSLGDFYMTVLCQFWEIRGFWSGNGSLTCSHSSYSWVMDISILVSIFLSTLSFPHGLVCNFHDNNEGVLLWNSCWFLLLTKLSLACGVFPSTLSAG